jgi:hypothetical protein
LIHWKAALWRRLALKAAQLTTSRVPPAAQKMGLALVRLSSLSKADLSGYEHIKIGSAAWIYVTGL